jgi:hypothetical protein
MNSDKMDQYFREQIQSLDRVKVPDTLWASERSWDRIQPKRKKAVIFWWSGGSVAAVILLLLGYFWFSPKLESTTESIASHDQKIETESNMVSIHTEPEIVPEKIADAIGQPQNQVESTMQASNNSEEVKRKSRNHNLSFLESLVVKNPFAQANPGYKPPAFRYPEDKTQIEKKESIAFNRVYVFKKGSGNNSAVEPDKNELAVRIDLTMKSANEPPGGLLAGLRK